MRSRAAQIQIRNRSTIASPIEQRTHSEELIERKFAVEDVASGEPVGVFQIARRDDLVAYDLLRQVGCVARDRFHDRISQRNTLSLRVAVLQLKRSILHVN